MVIIHLGQVSPLASSDLPGNQRGPRLAACADCFPIWSCSGWGLPCHRRWPARCALTAPFHPYPAIPRGGIFSVALSVGSRPPGVTWHPVLRSPDFPLSPCAGLRRACGSDHPADLPSQCLRSIFNFQSGRCRSLLYVVPPRTRDYAARRSMRSRPARPYAGQRGRAQSPRCARARHRRSSAPARQRRQ